MVWEWGISEKTSAKTEIRRTIKIIIVKQSKNPETVSEKLVETRHSSRECRRPHYLEDYTILVQNSETYVEDFPGCFYEIQKRENINEWYRTANEEINSLERNQTWTLIELPPGHKAIGNKWIFKIKREGNVSKHKTKNVHKEDVLIIWKHMHQL